MVLTTAKGRGGCRRALRASDESGSQSIEFALALPFVMLAIVLLLHAALFAADVVTAQALALQAARAASTGDDRAVSAALEQAAGRRRVEVTVEPPDSRRSAGDPVAATVRLRTAAFEPFGAAVWIPARVTLRTERP